MLETLQKLLNDCWPSNGNSTGPAEREKLLADEETPSPDLSVIEVDPFPQRPERDTKQPGAPVKNRSHCGIIWTTLTEIPSYRRAGRVNTGLAMLGQGLLGGALLARLCHDYSTGVVIVAFTIGFFTAFFGKFFLVDFFNDFGASFEAFKPPYSMLRIEDRRDAPFLKNPFLMIYNMLSHLLLCLGLHPKHASLMNGLIRAMALPFSLSFAGLVGLAFTNDFLPIQDDALDSSSLAFFNRTTNSTQAILGTAEIFEEFDILSWVVDNIFRNPFVALALAFTAFLSNYSFAMPGVAAGAHGLAVSHFHMLRNYLGVITTSENSPELTRACEDAVFRGLSHAMRDHLKKAHKKDKKRGRLTEFSIGEDVLNYDIVAGIVNGAPWTMHQGHCNTSSRIYNQHFYKLLNLLDTESKRLVRTDDPLASSLDARQHYGMARQVGIFVACGLALTMCYYGFNKPFFDLAAPILAALNWMVRGGHNGLFTKIPPEVIAYPTVAGMMIMAYGNSVPIIRDTVLRLTCFDTAAIPIFSCCRKILLGALIAVIVITGATPVMEQAVNAETGIGITLASGGSSALMETAGMILYYTFKELMALDSKKDTDVEAKITLYYYFLAKILEKLSQVPAHRATEELLTKYNLGALSMDSRRNNEGHRRKICGFWFFPNPFGKAAPLTPEDSDYHFDSAAQREFVNKLGAPSPANDDSDDEESAAPLRSSK